MRSQSLFRVAVVGFCGLALCACQTLREQAGLVKEPPDEFAVVTKAPLIVPPNYNLRPPSPGAAPLNQTDPTTSAQGALFSSADPQTVAAGMTGNDTLGEKLLLANAGVQNADPSIRAELQSDQPNMEGANTEFTDRVLAGSTNNSTYGLKPAPAPKQKSSGWFDWF